jgi:hypothetical protein
MRGYEVGVAQKKSCWLWRRGNPGTEYHMGLRQETCLVGKWWPDRQAAKIGTRVKVVNGENQPQASRRQYDTVAAQSRL